MSLERRVPLNRATEGARRFAAQRSRLPNRSRRRTAEQSIRDRVRDETIAYAGGMCQARALLPGIDCVYFLHDRHGEPTGNVHEVIKRSRRPGAHLDVSLTLYICAAHDDLILRGDFRPGRFGLLLADVEPLAEPVPFKGGQGLSRSWEPAA